MSAFNIWRENPPPRDAVVMARWALTGLFAASWQLVKTCKRGCCVHPYPSDGMGSMTLPKYWREPTPEEMTRT